MRDLDLIIFSKDRAAQLDLLLRSLDRFIDPNSSVRGRVLFTASDQDYARGYAMAEASHGHRRSFVQEREFSTDTLRLLDGSHRFTMFLVDDDVCIAPISLDSAEVSVFSHDATLACLSLRMHPGISFCYTQQRETPAPRLEAGNRWLWRDQPGDWGYPMSLDGHLFRSADIVPLIRASTFRHPNAMEEILARHPLEGPMMACFSAPKIINIPANRVQSVFPNRNMGQDPRIFNERFLAGERLDLEAILALPRSKAVHRECELQFQ